MLILIMLSTIIHYYKIPTTATAAVGTTVKGSATASMMTQEEEEEERGGIVRRGTGHIHSPHISGISELSYSSLGDVNIGALALAFQSGRTPALKCHKKTRRLSSTLDNTEAIAYAVGLVNGDPNLLPNVTLGFIVRGICMSPSVALATSLSFLPRVAKHSSNKGNGVTESHDNCNSGGQFDTTTTTTTTTANNTTTTTNTTINNDQNNNNNNDNINNNNNNNNITNNNKDSTFFHHQSSNKFKTSCLGDSNPNSNHVIYSDKNDDDDDDVIGVVSTNRDDLTSMISSLYSTARLPIVGTTEIADSLSDKSHHPYFFRLSPPNIYQIKAILKFLSSNRWSYISILYIHGTYGQNSYQSMDRNVGKYGICVATNHRLDHDSDYDAIVKDLLKYPRARAVVVFVFGQQLRKILRAVQSHNATGHFIFLASDLSVTYSGFDYVGKPNDPAIGIFVFDIYHRYTIGFYEYIQKQNATHTKNPWLRGAFEYVWECSYDETQSRIRPCSSIDKTRSILNRYRYRTDKSTSLRIDAVLTLAHAAHNLLQDKCPDAVGKAARACITGPLLHAYLKNTSFEGCNGRVEFDGNHDVKGKYVIGQFVYDYYDYPFTNSRRFKHMTVRPIGVYTTCNDTISYYKDRPIFWNHVKILKRIVPMKSNSSFASISSKSQSPESPLSTTNSSTLSSTSSSSSSSSSTSSSSSPSSSSSSTSFNTFFFPTSSSLPPEIPESVCSRPCVVGEYQMEKDVPCCWECLKCRENERIVQDTTLLLQAGAPNCQACPLFTWPDPTSGFTTCEEIHPNYPSINETIPIILISIAITCLIISIAILIAFIVYRNHKVIKASSFDLSVIQLAAILVGYVTVILHQTTPTDAKCVAISFMFYMSFALLYCPLLIKTIRIFRIFNKGANPTKPRCISNSYQLAFSASLISVQASLCWVDFFLHDSKAKLTQDIRTRKFVELSCDLSFAGLAAFLAYNLVQVFLCSVFAFKVRHLPDNFNESKFISMCVSATLVIWLAFIPTYLTAHQEVVQTFLLSTALLMNHSVALFMLFVPKLYAARWVAAKESTTRNSVNNNLNFGQSSSR